MHRYYFLTPLRNAPNIDPGVTFITHGCKYLISQADPDALFFPISNTEYSQADWDLFYDQADALILAGNPLYDPDDIHVYWNYEIWDHVNQAQARGIPIADLWGYSSFPLPAPELKAMAEQLLTNSMTKRVLEIQSRFNMIITRDLCAQLVASSMRQDVDALPCCSYWAHRYFNVSPKTREFNCITIRWREGYQWTLKPLYALSHTLAQETPTFLLCHTAVEYWWAKGQLPEAENLICIFDPRSLLNFYSRCKNVISIRLHGSIPALSLGCNVINISIDTRSQALDLFNIPSIPYTDLKKPHIPLTFHSLEDRPTPPTKYFIDRFKEEISSIF